MIRYSDPREDFRNTVWVILRETPDVYQAAKQQETEINALIDQGNDAKWDAESIASAIQQSAS